MDLQLNKKRVLVTGASKGIGLECALAVAREGATPILGPHDASVLKSVADDIRNQSGFRCKFWH